MTDSLPTHPGRTPRTNPLLGLALLCLAPGSSATQESESVDFEQDVFPLLQKSCLECHDEKKQRGELRLDSRAAALRGGAEGPVLVPGSARDSELIRRISLPPEDEDIMPARGDPLKGEQIELFRRWIDQGADWPDSVVERPHWSYVGPERPPLPAVRDES